MARGRPRILQKVNHSSARVDKAVDANFTLGGVAQLEN